MTSSAREWTKWLRRTLVGVALGLLMFATALLVEVLIAS